MRGASYTVNTVRGESALSCNTFVTLKYIPFLTGFSQAKAKARLAVLNARIG
jgi:hypothetical protein